VLVPEEFSKEILQALTILFQTKLAKHFDF